MALRPITAGDQDEFLSLARASAGLHHPWRGYMSEGLALVLEHAGITRRTGTGEPASG